MMRLVEHPGSRQQVLRPATPSIELNICDGAAREDARRYIAGIFRISYGAEVSQFMPLLVGLRENGSLTSALGLRGAARSPLFSEQYLDQPAEAHVASLFGTTVGRERILEMGNLVASNRGHASLLYTLVGAAMYEAGVDYLLFTANRAVRISLKRSGLDSVPIASADRSLLGAAGDKWGSYYNGDPKVMLGDVRTAMERCTSRPETRDLLRHYRASIDELVTVIQSQLQ